MSFQPVLPLTGYAGWRFLERTMERQQDAFNQSPGTQKELDYFAENIGKVTSADDLVSDYRLLKVALGAFGLQDEIGNKYFIKKVLTEGVDAEGALANKLADKSYYNLAKAFSFISSDAAAATTGNEFANDLSLKIEGTGYLAVTTSTGEIAYTRNASLKRGADGQIVTAEGYTVASTRDTSLLGGAGDGTETDGGNPTFSGITIPDFVETVTVNDKGEVYGNFEGGGRGLLLGRLVLTSFADEEGLAVLGADETNDLSVDRETAYFTATEESGDPITGRPLQDGFGSFARGEAVEAQEIFDAASITAAFLTRSFEVAVGEQDDDMRLALNIDRELVTLADDDMSEDAKWFSIMGSEPMRAVFDVAFGLPDSFASLDLDRQLDVYKAKAKAMFGDTGVAQFSGDEMRDKLIKMFMVRSEASSGVGYSSGQIALTLLGG
ncbi:hypothetical protein BV509_04370 [Rhodovulum sulfidophilum]|uniref:DUF1217 domain-containing protein n=1 Tax=Rhodovulum visakhapatnamense TaxID=364297 RepID=A0ABS1REM7_9RHOB|nr:DUF1217 domain-containing protein [Rhodovulum visakhapatnamense]MBL3568967.1 DUF1217 domain-containing protein [Rhodovulum visakhapatnamense]MBL3578102.1 DUF1217 domain-containing protein [Rhodovulum visakhapatnamense]OLS43639.1 hypothetical protein BV509_04370 [Rhodovulum sulfidophilum]